MRVWVCFWVMTVLWIGVKTAPVLAAPSPLPTDHSPLTYRRANSTQWERLRNDRQYQYTVDLVPPENPLLSLWLRFMQWLGRWLYKPGAHTMEWITGGIVGGIAVFVVLKLLKMDVLALFGRRPAGAAFPYSLGTENIHEMDFDAEIARALQDGQFRLVVRLHYLKVLKRLTQQAMIDWQPTKTNHTYVEEVQDPSLRSVFQRLTNRFESIWYGDFPLGKEQFEALVRDFDAFEKALATQKTA